MPWRVDPGNDLILNTHLKPTGRVETVQPRIGLYFTDTPPTRAPILLQLAHDAALNIPAGDSHFVVEDSLRLPIAVYAGQEVDARMLLERAWMEHRLTRDRTDTLAAYNLASLDTMSGSPAGAIAIYRKLVAAQAPHSPDAARVATSLGVAQQQNGDWQSALATYRHALTLDPNYADARYDLATLELQHNQSDAAAGDYRTLLEQHPDDAAAHGGLGTALAQLQQPDAARAEFDRALALDPSQTATLENYASLELAAGNPQHAQQLLTKAIAAGARDAATYQQLAFADQQTRHPVEAEAALRHRRRSLGRDQPLPARADARRARRSHQCHSRAAGSSPHRCKGCRRLEQPRRPSRAIRSKCRRTQRLRACPRHRPATRAGPRESSTPRRRRIEAISHRSYVVILSAATGEEPKDLQFAKANYIYRAVSDQRSEPNEVRHRRACQNGKFPGRPVLGANLPPLQNNLRRQQQQHNRNRAAA